jgi:hydroxyacylglutathione hydrolase
MLRVETFTFNDFQENTYLLINDNNQCWIIDPGMYRPAETQHFFDFIQHHKLIPQAVINTHTHIDHIFGVQACLDTFNIPFLIHPKDVPLLNMAPASATLWGLNFSQSPQPTSFLDETKPLAVGTDQLNVRFTPGHSPGSVSFYSADGGWVIGGDVLFSGSIGRTDLPGGNYDTLIDSIKTELMTLPDATLVYSGHGPATTIDRERQHNPFLQG